jgi:PGF-pre-PGF domain-containing protein
MYREKTQEKLRKKHKTGLLITVLLCFLVVFLFIIGKLIVNNALYLSITAKMIELSAQTSVFIRPVIYDIKVGCPQDSISPDQSLSGNISVTNYGSYEGDSEIFWWIEDNLGNSLNISGSTTVNINPSYTWSSIESLLIPSTVSEGIYYYKVNASASGFTATAHCSFLVSLPTVTIAPIFGGGTPAGISNETTPNVIAETKIIEKIPENVAAILKIETPELPITEIRIVPNQTIENVKITVKNKPCEEIKIGITGLPYKTFCIEKNIPAQYIKKGEIEFRVEKDWVIENEINASDIGLYKYIVETEIWKKLPTSFVREDQVYLYFVSETLGFSSFSIIGAKIGVAKAIEVFYPTDVIVFLNTTKEVNIKIKNSGYETLQNLKLIVQGLELAWFNISPSSIDLNPNTTQEFKIELEIPHNALIKNYPVNILIKSDNFERSIQLNVNVLKIYDKNELEAKIEELGKNIKTMETDLEDLNATGKDITTTQLVLTLAKQRLDEAEQEMQIENYEKATELVYEVENTIKIVQSAFQTKPIELNILFFIFTAIIVISIIVLSLNKMSTKKNKFLEKIKKFFQK